MASKQRVLSWSKPRFPLTHNLDFYIARQVRQACTFSQYENTYRLSCLVAIYGSQVTDVAYVGVYTTRGILTPRLAGVVSMHRV